jgi:ribosome-binding factor A
MHSRITQLNDLIRDTLSDLLVRELSLKQGVILTVTHVSTAKNLRSTHASVSVFPEGERDYAMKTLAHEGRLLQKFLHRKLSTRPLPKLFFELDTTEEHADVIEHLLRDIRESDARDAAHEPLV